MLCKFSRLTFEVPFIFFQLTPVKFTPVPQYQILRNTKLMPKLFEAVFRWPIRIHIDYELLSEHQFVDFDCLFDSLDDIIGFHPLVFAF